MTPSPMKATFFASMATPCSQRRWLWRGRESGALQRGPPRAGRCAPLCRSGPARVIAACDGAFGSEKREHVLCDPRGKAPQVRERQVGKFAALVLRVPHGSGHGFVRVAERDALAYEIVGEIGGAR